MDYKLKRIFYDQNSHHVLLLQGQSLGLFTPSVPTMLREREDGLEEGTQEKYLSIGRGPFACSRLGSWLRG